MVELLLSWGDRGSRNQLLSLEPGGTLRFQGTLNEEARVTVGGQAAEVRPDNTFEGRAEVGSGTTEVEVEAQDYAGNIRTNTYDDFLLDSTPGPAVVVTLVVRADSEGSLAASDGAKVSITVADAIETFLQSRAARPRIGDSFTEAPR